jgi:anti-anti-sigma factor
LSESVSNKRKLPHRLKGLMEMQLSTEEMDGGITRVALDGRMDIAGAAAVDMKMNLIAGSAKKLLIDLQKVEFLGSMGLRSIVHSRARGQQPRRQGRPVCAQRDGGIGSQDQPVSIP